MQCNHKVLQVDHSTHFRTFTIFPSKKYLLSTDHVLIVRYCIRYTHTHLQSSLLKSFHLQLQFSHLCKEGWLLEISISYSLYPFPFSCHVLKKNISLTSLPLCLMILLWWYVYDINSKNQMLTAQYLSIQLAHFLPSFFCICPLLLDSKSQLLTEAWQSGNGVPRDAACVFRSRYWSGAACVASSCIAWLTFPPETELSQLPT